MEPHSVVPPTADELREYSLGKCEPRRAAQIEATLRQRGLEPPIDPKHLATAGIALDIGLAVQNLVDPDDVPLEVYPLLYELLLGRLVAPEPAATASRGGGSSRASRRGRPPSRRR